MILHKFNKQLIRYNYQEYEKNNPNMIAKQDLQQVSGAMR